MAEISPAAVKELRERTGAGMMDCKKALAESGGAIDPAIEWLRKKGLAAAAKKAGRVAAEGLVAVVTEGGIGAMLEVNSETDFVARNDAFQAFVRVAASEALAAGGDLEALKARPYPGTARTVGEELAHLVGTIGENLTLRRSVVLRSRAGVVASYLHNAAAPGLGRIGVLVALESRGDPARLGELGRRLAMHVAAATPRAVCSAELDPALLETERRILAEQAAASGKPPAVIEKMVEGRLRKFHEEVVLLEQTYLGDPEKSDMKVAKVLDAAGRELGAEIVIAGFARFQLGEGIEKKASDFAAEVAAAAGRA